jgi:hypothetical protein
MLYFLIVCFSASLVPAGCLIGVCLAEDDVTTVVVLMMIATFFFAPMWSGVFSNHVDLAPNYAGIIFFIFCSWSNHRYTRWQYIH